MGATFRPSQAEEVQEEEGADPGVDGGGGHREDAGEEEDLQ